MPSTFFGLNISYSGLLASNASLNTTANNISNVQTEGYSRQQVNQQAASAIRTFTTFGSAGAGVETLSIERIRDEFYDQKYWSNNTNVGEYEMKAYYMKQIEQYFYDSSTTAGFSDVFDTLMIKGIEELMKNPGDSSTKTQFVGYASALTDYFNSTVGNLQKVQKDLNAEIKLKVDEINSIASEIVELNKQINTIEMGGAMKANELRDRRTALVDRLSEIVDVSISETPVVDLNDPDRVTGANRFVVKIAGGQILVDMNSLNQLDCKARENYEKVNMSDIDGLYDVYWVTPEGEPLQKFGLYNASMGGELRGLVQMRDGNNGEYFNGLITNTTVSDYVDDNGGLHDTVTIKVTEDYLTDLNKSNLSDQGGILNLGNKEFYYDSWTYKATKDGSGNISYEYTFVLSNETSKNSSHITNDRIGKNATIGSSVKYEGIPYYMSQLNEWVRTFSEKFNDILKKGNDNTGTILFTGNHATDTDQYQFNQNKDYHLFEKEAANGTSLEVNVHDDSYYKLTAGNFSTLVAMMSDPKLMSNKYKTADGVEQDDLLTDLKKMVNAKEGTAFRGGSAAEFLESVISDVALNASAADTFRDSYKTVQNTIETNRLSISGVDEDEEAVNLVKFQNAYNLNSKMIQVFQEIYNRLILETGV